ncbi:DUF2959 domain-containing protein [Thalassotalea euphylliae]|uniref:DUF2959 domain-containing protein n=1 Tax=Thalassotalea euphylliae TaxID=1655234 RepID=A0A3E0TL73_9GAMM|nr:DUF2959 domain-containing protein [Thalassotalea euphylliae]REL25266.1 DUF2959 domain-containing protein [Thalassotalea euphylliae]
MRLLNLIKITALIVVLQGCQSAYYSAMESFGKHKRDLLADEVENAQEAQQEAQQQFASALEQLSTMIAFDGGDLQDQFEATEAQYEASVEAADTVSKRIDNIEDVASALFEEWSDEIEQYSSAKLKRQSESQLRETQRRYQRLLSAMQRAERKMAPVLAALKDNTLYLKHNLNAKAIGALEGEYQDIKTDINSLIGEMNKAIEESEKFLSSLETSG